MMFLLGFVLIVGFRGFNYVAFVGTVILLLSCFLCGLDLVLIVIPSLAVCGWLRVVLLIVL